MVHHEIRNLTAADGHPIRTQYWRPDRSPSCVIQVLHGLGEYSDRYGRFAAAASERGFAVVAHDHRGHGPDAITVGHVDGARGWLQICRDVETVFASVREEFAGLPVVMLGHSMGSYIAQYFAMNYGGNLAGLILSASTWAVRAQLFPALAIAHLEKLRLGDRGESRLLYQLGFSKFNNRFRPARTPYDWLSRDESEVDKYVADPLCGGPYSCGLWLALLNGLIEISSDNAVSRIPSDLPILITGGSMDPVGGNKGMGKLAMHYAQTLHQRLTVKIFDGSRHEMLNEINRDDATSAWLDWVAASTGVGGPTNAAQTA